MSRTYPIKRARFEQVLARLLILIALLNLNGASFMLLGITQIFSLGMLAFALGLLGLHNRIRVDLGVFFFLFVALGYLFFGVLFIPLFRDSQASMSPALSMIGTLLLTLSLTAHIRQLRYFVELDRLLRFTRNVAVFSAVFVLASPLLYQIYTYPPPSAMNRNAGLFANPNNAGLSCALAFILVLVAPFKSRVMTLAILGIVFVATFATFSRTAILLVMLISFLSILRAGLWVRLIVVPTVLLIVLVAMSDPTRLMDTIANQTIVELQPTQIKRLTTTIAAATGTIDNDTTSGRTELWVISIKKAVSVFPLGTGLNTFHAIEGGIMGNTNWLGSHNTFLMLWGESGLIVMVAYILLTIFLFLYSFQSSKPRASFYLFLLFLVSSMVSHGALTHRFMNVALALMLGIGAFRQTGPSQPMTRHRG